MIDKDDASADAAEEHDDREQKEGGALWPGTPRWFLVLVVAVVLGQALVFDLRSLVPAPSGWFLRWGVPLVGLLVLTTAAMVTHRHAPMPAHRAVLSVRLSRLTIVVGLYSLLLMIGIPMRYLGIPFTQTTSAVGALLLLLLCEFVWSRRRCY